MKCKAVILVGGPSKATRFRPLSLEVPKVLFPVANRPLLHHHLDACMQVTGMSEIILLGFYDNSVLEQFIQNETQEFNIPIRYFKEPEGGAGTAGGLNAFRQQILGDSPDFVFLLHCDICCTFPLSQMLHFHQQHSGIITMMGTRVPQDQISHYGCLVEEPTTHHLLHYVEKPESFVNNLINGGVYIFSPQAFDEFQQPLSTSRKRRRPDQGDAPAASVLSPRSGPASATPHTTVVNKPARLSSELALRLEQDVMTTLAGQNKVFVYEHRDFWTQIKHAGITVRCAEHYLQLYHQMKPQLLAMQQQDGPQIVGDVAIHPTATVDPTAKIGPNVSIGANVVVKAGARIFHSIILDRVVVHEHALIHHSLVGWESVIGQWTRLEGVTDVSSAEQTHSNVAVSILGKGVALESEIVVRNCIVLPHKALSHSHHSRILL